LLCKEVNLRGDYQYESLILKIIYKIDDFLYEFFGVKEKIIENLSLR